MLEFLPELFDMLKNEGYTMTEAEASIFLPCLVEKVLLNFPLKKFISFCGGYTFYFLKKKPKKKEVIKSKTEWASRYLFQFNYLKFKIWLTFYIIIFLPWQSGHNIEKVREKMRELMKKIIYTYSASKTFPYILEGLRSRNNRTRIECVDLVGFLLDNHGSEANSKSTFFKNKLNLFLTEISSSFYNTILLPTD